MHYLELRNALKDFTIFSFNDIKSLKGNFFRTRLNEWQDKGYIIKVVRGYYVFSDLKLNEKALFEISNKIYPPSYISFEMALSYYQLIPESVYGITAVSTRRTYRFKTRIAEFIYRTVTPRLFFGYILVKYGDKYFKIASMEKAILDYLYINPNIKDEDGFASLRINKDMFFKQLSKEKLYMFLERFNQKALRKRSESFLRFMSHA
ncbi:MAG: hypothetical protein ABIG92_01795 [Candidatus Omnitrophota bacterium]